jgi:hemin uptake protein HemP
VSPTPPPGRKTVAAEPRVHDLGQSAPDGLAAKRRWRSQEILGSSTEVEIQHGSAVYRLRATASGKLILTK